MFPARNTPPPSSRPRVALSGFSLLRMSDLSLAVPSELTDAMVEAEKPGNRAILLRHLDGIVQLCERELEGDELGGTDVRWAELKLRTLREMSRLLRLEKVDLAPVADEVDPVVDSARKRERLIASFDDLEARMLGE